jgi:hypothetical protein
MKCKYLVVSAVLAFAGLQGQARASILGSAENFTVLGGSTVTNTGPTTVTGNLGVSPGSAITGFPPGQVVDGTQYVGSLATLAEADTLTAYNNLAAMPVTANLTGQDTGRTG